MARELRLAGKRIEQLTRCLRGAVADDLQERREILNMRTRDHGAILIDEIEFLVVLPHRERRALDEADIDRVWQQPLDRGRAYPRHCLEPCFRRLEIEIEDRRA